MAIQKTRSKQKPDVRYYVAEQKEELDQSTNQYCKFNSQTLTMFTSSLNLAALFCVLLGVDNDQETGPQVFHAYGRLRLLLRCSSQCLCYTPRYAHHRSDFVRCWCWFRHSGNSFIKTKPLSFFLSLLQYYYYSHTLNIITKALTCLFQITLQSVPLFVSEMAPHRYRGTLNVCFQLFITIGILIAGLVNYFTNMIKGDLGWRISLGGAAVPAVLMIFSSLWVSETPNSLIERGHLDKAKKQLQRIRGVADVQAEFNDLVDASAASKEVEHPWRDLSMRKYRPQLCLAILIPMFQQLTGINVVMFYAPVLFKTIGFQSNASLASAMITGGVNVLATFISVFGTDRWGRKPLFLWGAFAFSWGPLGWLVPSEIFPLEIRSSAQSIVVAVNMSFTFLVAQLFLAALCMVKYGLFIIFAGLVLIMSLFIIFFVPETNNIPIEEMSQTASEEEDDACSSFLDGIGSEENGGNDLDDGLMVRDTDMDMARVRVRIRDQLLNLDNIACYEKCSMMNF
ncbi:hypothetical protein ACSBR2_011984 [Camellia fascicularis]